MGSILWKRRERERKYTMYYIMNAIGGLRIVFTVCIILSLCCSIRYSFFLSTIVIATIDYDGAAAIVARGLVTIPDEPMLKINTNTATIRSSSSKTSIQKEHQQKNHNNRNMLSSSSSLVVSPPSSPRVWDSTRKVSILYINSWRY